MPSDSDVNSRGEDVHAANLTNEPLTRRELVATILGAFGAAALSGCSSDTSGDCANEPLSVAAEALTAGRLMWVETVLGATPTYPASNRPGDLAKNNAGAVGATVVIARGAVSPGDGGGGIFIWNAANGVDDGGTIIVPGPTTNIGSSGPCWKRIYSGPIDVRWFGAKGIDDPQNPVDATPAIQAAINAVSQVVSGGVPFDAPRKIFIPNARNGYKLTGTLRIRQCFGLTIECETPTSSLEWCQLRWYGPANVPVIQFTGVCNAIALKNVSINCNSSGTSRALCGIAFGEDAGDSQVNFCTTDQLFVYGGRFGIRYSTYANTFASMSNHTHRAMIVQGSTDAGIASYSGNVAGVVFDACGFGPNGFAPVEDAHNPQKLGANILVCAGEVILVGCTSGGTFDPNPDANLAKSADIFQQNGIVKINGHWSDSHGIFFWQGGVTRASTIKGVQHAPGGSTEVTTPVSMLLSGNVLLEGCFLFGDVVCCSGRSGSVTAIGTEFYGRFPGEDLAALRPTLGKGRFKGFTVENLGGLIELNGQGNQAQMVIGGLPPDPANPKLNRMQHVGAALPKLLLLGSEHGWPVATAPSAILQALCSPLGNSGFTMRGPFDNTGGFEFDVNCYVVDAAGNFAPHKLGDAWRILFGGQGGQGGLTIYHRYYEDMAPSTDFVRLFSIVQGLGSFGAVYAREAAIAFPQMAADPSFSSGTWWQGAVYFNTTTKKLRLNTDGGRDSWVDL